MKGLVKGDRAIVTGIVNFDIFKGGTRIWNSTSWIKGMEIFLEQSSIVYKVAPEEYALELDGKAY